MGKNRLGNYSLGAELESKQGILPMARWGDLATFEQKVSERTSNLFEWEYLF